MQRSSRDVAVLAARMAGWLAGVLPPGADPQVEVTGGIDANGLSSETLALAITRTEDGARRTGRYVARVAPAPEDLPVFPEYALQVQHEVMRLVGELSGVPVPPVRWLE